MSGGTMFEQHHAPLPMHSSQEMMADWSATPSMNGMRRDKEMIAPSPTYSHASQVESVASPYSHPQTLMMPGYAPGGYVASTPVVQSSHYPTSQATSYYTAPVEYDIYQTPASARSTARGKLGRTPSAYGDQQAFTPTPVGTHSGYDVGVPLVAASSSLTRTYDSTITQYYPYTSDRSSWGSAPDKDVGQKRKRAVKEALQPLMTNKPAVTSSAKSLRTPKRSKHDGDKWSQPEMNSQASHLPTPPATGNEASTTAASRQKKSDTKRSVTPADSVSSGASSEKRRVGIKTSAEEGRVLVVGAAAAAESADGEDVQDASATETKAERKLAMPALSTDESGLATLSTDMVLESELDWLQNGGRASPPSSPDQAVLQTPVLGPRLLDAEVTDTPMTKASKVTRRLERFAQEPVTKADEPMICTKINMFGRVAVRKDMAIKFLGLDGGAGLVEQIKHEDEDDWSERLTAASSSQSAAAASSSTAAVKPSWPDELAPWSLAGGSRKEKIRKEESEKADMLKRYLEGASDESSDDDDEFVPTTGAMGKGKGKSVSRLVSGPIAAAGHGSHRDPRRPAYRASYYNPSADAKAALLTVLRHRALPVIAPGVVACLCGAQTANGMGSMIACHSCKTWHHLVCNNLADGDQLTPRWWCPSCEQSMRNATPIRTPVGAYIQAVERSSAFKGDMVDVALAPSPLFPTNGFSRITHPLQTPLLPARAPGSPGRPPQRQRVLSFANDLWTYPEDGAAAPASAVPSTPAPASRRDEFSTHKPDDLPFDVHSTPSRHLDSIFGGSSLFPMTPAHGRARVPSSGMMYETPMTLSSRLSGHGSLASRHDYLRDLGNGEQATPTPAMGGLLPPPSPQTSKWPHALMGAQNLSPSPFGHRRSMSGSNKLSSMRSSSRSSVMGLGLPLDKDDE